MELVGILRLLWRERVLVAVAAIVAIFAGFALAFPISFPPKLESRQYEVGLGSLEALVDTPSSQVVDLGGDTGADIETLAGRATLLASLMTSSPLKDEIARRAGVDARELIAIPPSGAGSGATSSPEKSGTGIDINDPRAKILKAKVPTLDSGDVPIISVNTQAPTAAVAARLADESVKVLKDHLKSVAGADNVPDARQVVVAELGPARSSVESRGPAQFLGIVAGLFVFLLGCAAIVGVTALASGWRRLAAMELVPDEVEPWELPDYDPFAVEETDRADARAADAPNPADDESTERSRSKYPNAVGLLRSKDR